MEKIMTLHPAGKGGKNIEKPKYDAMNQAIVQSLSNNSLLTHTELSRAVSKLLPKFEGSLEWYLETVKLDLEARHIIERTFSVPPKYRLR
jgi:hypothetical protein